MKPKLFAKRVLSLILCVVMLLSCWVFTAPDVYANQTDGNYSVKVKIEVTKNDNMKSGTYVRLNYGGTYDTLYSLSKNKVQYYTTEYTREIPSFPTGVKINMVLDGWFGNATWKMHVYIYNYNSGGYQELSCSGDTGGNYAMGTDNHYFEIKVKDSQKPYAASIAGINGSDTLTLNPDGGAVSESYSPGLVRDQYGYNISGATATLTSDNAGGTSFTSNTLYGDANCNSSNDYPVTLTATYGSITTTKTVTVQTFDYTVNFVNYDGSSIATQTGIDYGGSADVPTNAQYTITKPADNTYTYTHDDTQWSGDYTNLSGVQTKTVTATYTPHYIDYTVTFNNDDGSLYASGTYHYGDTVSAPATNPSKQQDDENTYEFAGWSPAVATTCTGSAVYTAQYTPSKRNYTVQFKDADGNVIPGFTQTLNWNAAITAPDTNPTKASTSTIDYTFNKWVNEADGSDYTGRCVGSINYIPSWTESTRHYTVTFQKEDGTVISSNSEMLYQSVPSQAGIVPALIDKAPDDNGHYTAAWDRDVTQPITGDTIFKIVYTLVPHTWVDPAGVVKTPATCVATGVKVVTCSVCNHEVEQEIPIDSTNHDPELKQNTAPDDRTAGKCYYQCTRCDKYFAAFDNGTDYYPDDTAQDTLQDALDVEGSAEIPAPTFNSYDDSRIGYNYDDRGASLKLTKETEAGLDTIQKMRFAGSVAVPANIPKIIKYDNYAHYINGELDQITDSDCILDFGFVYTQMQYIAEEPADAYDPYEPDLSQMVIGGDNMAKMSVPSKNSDSGTLDISKKISTWAGVTPHQDSGLTFLTFNLLINVKEKNWKRIYAARTYITYKYHGEIYTVYDGTADDYGSARAVWYVASVNLAMYGEETEPYIVKMCQFLRENITEKDNIEPLIQSDGNGTDWWKYRNDYGLEPSEYDL